jgi:hypothetical protein
MDSSEYSRAYEAAKRELAELLASEERFQKRKMELRKTIDALSTLCETESLDIDPSAEAVYLLQNTTLADEIRSILHYNYPLWTPPGTIKLMLEDLGHDLSRYRNPQATIHMVLKRIVEAGEGEESISDDGKQVYRAPSLTQRIRERLGPRAVEFFRDQARASENPTTTPTAKRKK